MEIKNSLLKGADPYKAALEAKEQVGQRPQAAQAQKQTAPPSGDRVSLSPAALLHNTAKAAAENAPDIRQEKVDELKERVASGTYSVDSRKVAEKLLQNESLLASSLNG